MALLPLVKTRIKKTQRRTAAFFKKVAKRPHLVVRTCWIIALFGMVIITSGVLLKSLPQWDFSVLPAQVSNTVSNEALFATPAKNFFRGSPEMTFVQHNSVVAIAPPTTVDTTVLGGFSDIETSSDARRGVLEYTVEQGDTLSSIAERFGVSLNSVLWANDMSTRSTLKVGKKLVIPPMSGVIHHVKNGDTIGALAQRYKGKAADIIAFNELSGEGDIFIGDALIIPGGTMPKTAPLNSRHLAQVPVGSTYFIAPHAAKKITQGLHWYNAIDFGGKCGDPIYAAAGGTVQRVKYGWNSGAGNTVTVLHPNGVVTSYGHISSSLVSSGQQVSQGQIIALMGGKPGTPGAGRSTGCHVHFGVKGAKNPFAR